MPVFAPSLSHGAESILWPSELSQCIRSRLAGRVDGLTVECDGWHVLVTGRCRSHHVKQLVTEAVLSAEPGVWLHNAIEVC
jgi:hypothetical protein